MKSNNFPFVLNRHSSINTYEIGTTDYSRDSIKWTTTAKGLSFHSVMPCNAKRKNFPHVGEQTEVSYVADNAIFLLRTFPSDSIPNFLCKVEIPFTL